MAITEIIYNCPNCGHTFEAPPLEDWMYDDPPRCELCGHYDTVPDPDEKAKVENERQEQPRPYRSIGSR